MLTTRVINERIETRPSLRLRRGEVADGERIFRVFKYALADLLRRLGQAAGDATPDDEQIAVEWAGMRSVYEHLSETAAHFWVAEENGQIIGFARALEQDGVRELTDFFVHPAAQSAGVGRELLQRAFPVGGARHRLILATPDLRAQALYLKAGVYPRFPIYTFSRRSPERTVVETDLRFEPVEATPQTLATLADLDRSILGYRRDADHRWLLQDRQGYLYLRRGRPVGYGYVGEHSGPFALLSEEDFPAVLTHAETASAEAGRDEFAVNVPMINRAAVDHLLRRAFRLGAFFCYFMSDVPFGRFQNYISTSPMLFL